MVEAGVAQFFDLTVNQTATDECISYIEANRTGVLISGTVMLLLMLVMFPVLLYLTIKLTKFVWHEEKVIPLMLFACSASTFFTLVYYIWYVCIYQWPLWMCRIPNNTQDTNYTNFPGFACSNAFIPNFPSYFLALAVILNLSKWTYFELKILAFIKVGKQATDELLRKE
jgi:hypothetical protein